MHGLRHTAVKVSHHNAPVRHTTVKTLRDIFTVRVAMDSAARQGTKMVLISSASRHMLSHTGVPHRASTGNVKMNRVCVVRMNLASAAGHVACGEVDECPVGGL